MFTSLLDYFVVMIYTNLYWLVMNVWGRHACYSDLP